MSQFKLNFLGTSSGGAIPRKDCSCFQCVSYDLKDCRNRSTLLVQNNILIDAGPDILKELTNNQAKKLKLVLITHDHQDHVGGLKDILKINPNISVIRLTSGQFFKFEGIEFHAFKVEHSKIIPTVGLQINNVIYIPDYADLSNAMKYLEDAEVAILDGSVLGRNFGGHLSINQSIALTKPLTNLKAIYFTHNGHTHKTHAEMEKLVKNLGDDRYHLAYDGLELKLEN